jgi:hypothetical protein
VAARSSAAGPPELREKCWCRKTRIKDENGGIFGSQISNRAIDALNEKSRVTGAKQEPRATLHVRTRPRALPAFPFWSWLCPPRSSLNNAPSWSLLMLALNPHLTSKKNISILSRLLSAPHSAPVLTNLAIHSLDSDGQSTLLYQNKRTRRTSSYYALRSEMDLFIDIYTYRNHSYGLSDPATR